MPAFRGIMYTLIVLLVINRGNKKRRTDISQHAQRREGEHYMKTHYCVVTS